MINLNKLGMLLERGGDKALALKKQLLMLAKKNPELLGVVGGGSALGGAALGIGGKMLMDEDEETPEDEAAESPEEQAMEAKLGIEKHKKKREYL